MTAILIIAGAIGFVLSAVYVAGHVDSWATRRRYDRWLASFYDRTDKETDNE